MKWTMMLAQDTLQVNLEPENDHEREALAILRKYDGAAVLHQGVSVAASHGGYLRDYGVQSETLAITIRKPVAKPASWETDNG